MLIQVPIVVAHKADRTAADGIRLTIENVNPGAALNNHNFMKIMMMLRETPPEEAGAQSRQAIDLPGKNPRCAVRS